MKRGLLVLLSFAVSALSFMLPLRQAIRRAITKGGPAACMSSNTRQPLRVGVVGAGVAGSVLAKKLKDAGAQVTIFEMGRGAGGRMATRRTRELPGLAINHGAPMFAIRHIPVRQLIEPLVAAGMLDKWEGRVVNIDSINYEAATMNVNGDTYHSRTDINMCEVLVQGIETKFGTQVVKIEKEGEEWVFFSKDRSTLGRFDWWGSYLCRLFQP